MVAHIRDHHGRTLLAKAEPNEVMTTIRVGDRVAVVTGLGGGVLTQGKVEAVDSYRRAVSLVGRREPIKVEDVIALAQGGGS